MRTLIRPRSRSGLRRGRRVDRSAGSAPGRRWVVLALVLLAALIMLPNQHARAGMDHGPTDRTLVHADRLGTLALPGSSSSFDGAITPECERGGGKPTITITDWPTSVKEGEPVNITLTRTADDDGEFPVLNVTVHRTETGRMLGRPWWSSVRFLAGHSTTVWQLSTANDTVVEKEVQRGDGLPGGRRRLSGGIAVHGGRDDLRQRFRNASADP